MKKIIHWHNGQCFVTGVNPSRSHAIEEIAKRVVPDGADFLLLEESEVPELLWQEAFEKGNGGVAVNMPKARECARKEIRRLRAPMFPHLDAEWMKATGQKNVLAADAIDAKRQRLRDAPQDPRIEAAQTTDELKALIGDCLQ